VQPVPAGIVIAIDRFLTCLTQSSIRLSTTACWFSNPNASNGWPGQIFFATPVYPKERDYPHKPVKAADSSLKEKRRKAMLNLKSIKTNAGRLIAASALIALVLGVGAIAAHAQGGCYVVPLHAFDWTPGPYGWFKGPCIHLVTRCF
jgi:hypothetical protein